MLPDDIDRRLEITGCSESPKGGNTGKVRDKTNSNQSVTRSLCIRNSCLSRKGKDVCFMLKREGYENKLRVALDENFGTHINRLLATTSTCFKGLSRFVEGSKPAVAKLA